MTSLFSQFQCNAMVIIYAKFSMRSKVEMANERQLKSEGEEVEESGEAKRGQRGPLRQNRIKKETARRRRQESTDG